MRLPAFTYLAPRTVQEASRMLADHGPAAAPVAGGTDLYPNMKRRQMEPAVLVGLQGIPGLRGTRRSTGGEATIGAMTSLRELESAAEASLALAQAASSVSSPQIRTMGTVGGNLCIDTRCTYYDKSESWREALGFCLKAKGDTCWVAPGGTRCWAVASSDLAPVAVSLDARAVLVSHRGERTVPVADLYRNDGLEPSTLAHDEILTELLIPPSEGLRAVYRKVRQRQTIDFPILGTAVAVRLGADGTCTDARITLGAVASAPLRAQEAERFLTGRRLTPEIVEEAARLAARPARPLGNTDLTHFYRKWMIPVHVARALRDLAGQRASTDG